MNANQMLNADFDTQVAKWMEEFKVPGVAIALIQDGQENSPEYRTFSDPGYPEINLKTRFPVASVTKLVSALALGYALDQSEHKLSFETLVRDILPEFKLSNEEIAKKCTIGDYTGHRCRAAGYDNLVFQAARDDMVSIVKYLPTSGELGDQPSSIVTTSEKTVLEPYGMISTGWSAKEAGDNLVHGFQAVHGEQGIEDRLMRFDHRSMDKLGDKMGIACMRLITTIEDMASLLHHLPQHPYWKYLSTPQLDPRKSVKPGGVLGEETLGRGTIGLQLGEHYLVGHFGACSGFRCHVVRNDQLGVGIAILANSSEGWDLANCIEGWMLERMTGTANLCERVYKDVLIDRTEWRKKVMADHPSIPTTDSTQLIGTFHSPAFGTMTFDASSNFPSRPAGNIMSVPWLPFLYGKTRPIVTSIGEGKFEACLEWTPDPEQDQSWGEVVYGWPFLVELKGEEILVYGMGISLPGTRFDVPPAVFTKVA